MKKKTLLLMCMFLLLGSCFKKKSIKEAGLPAKEVSQLEDLFRQTVLKKVSETQGSIRELNVDSVEVKGKDQSQVKLHIK